MSVIYKPSTSEIDYNLYYGLTSEQEMEVIELRTVGKVAIADIAEVMNCSRATIEKILIAYDLPLKMDRWPLDDLGRLARSCSSWKEFRTVYKDAYGAAIKKGVTEELKKLIGRNK